MLDNALNITNIHKYNLIAKCDHILISHKLHCPQLNKNVCFIIKCKLTLETDHLRVYKLM